MSIQTTFEEDIKELIKREDFVSEMEGYIVYYGTILAEKCKFNKLNDSTVSEDKKDRLLEQMTKFEQLLSPAIKNTFLKGYQIGLELVSNQDTVLNNETLENISLESQFLEAVDSYYSTGLYEFIRTAETHEFIMFAIRNFEDIKPTLEQILTEIAKFGALKVLQKLKTEKEVIGSITKTTELSKLPINQFVSITPSIRAYVMANEEHIEMWSLVWNSTLTTNPFQEVGEVTIVHRSKEKLEKEIEQQSIYSTNFSNMVGVKAVLELRVKIIPNPAAPRMILQTEYGILIESLVHLFEKQTNIEKENIIVWTY